MLKNKEICYNADNKNIGCDLLRIIGKIDIEKFKGISENIITDEVIITDKQIEHIEERRIGFYQKYCNYFEEILHNPNYIFQDTKNSNTALVCKEIKISNNTICVILRLATSKDNPLYKNSIITAHPLNQTQYNKYKRNKKIVYKNE